MHSADLYCIIILQTTVQRNIKNIGVIYHVGRDSSVGTATRYGLGGPGIESRWGRDFFAPLPDRRWGPPSLLYNGYRVFPWRKAAGA